MSRPIFAGSASTSTGSVLAQRGARFCYPVGLSQRGPAFTAGCGHHYNITRPTHMIDVMTSSSGYLATPREGNRPPQKAIKGGIMFRRSLVLAGFAVMCAGAASAATEKFQATLSPTSEVPPTKSTGSGEATASLDTATHELTYDVTFKGFASDVTAAHIHGPAEAGKNAGVLVPLGNAPTSPIHGTHTLTAQQQQQLEAGMMYVNVHTKNNPSGAIRGQLTIVK